MPDGVVYSDLIEVAENTFSVNCRVRARSDKLRDDLNALLFTHRLHRFPQLTGGSDITIVDCVRRLLRDFVSRSEGTKSFVGFSRGSVCQSCHNVIRYGAIEYDVVAGTSELRLDADCYKVFLEESVAVASDDSPDAA